MPFQWKNSRTGSALLLIFLILTALYATDLILKVWLVKSVDYKKPNNS